MGDKIGGPDLGPGLGPLKPREPVAAPPAAPAPAAPAPATASDARSSGKQGHLSQLGLEAAPSLLAAAPTTPLDALKDEVRSLVDGAKFKEAGAHWSAAELGSLVQVLNAMSPADRERLSGTTFERAAAPRGEHGKLVGGYEGGEATVDAHGKKSLTLYDAAASSAFEHAVGQDPVAGVLAHETGHLVQGFSREATLEFAKLGWTGQDGQKSYDDFRKSDPSDPYGHLQTDPQSPPITEVGQQGPNEDFAETYRLYLSDPAALMQASPDRFLFMNGRSGAYSPAEVQQLAQASGADLQGAFTRMATDYRLDLQQETLRGIGGASGLKLDAGTVARTADGLLSDSRISGLGKATALIARQVASGDRAFEARLLADPAAALAPFWNRLAPEVQQHLQTPGVVADMVSGLKQGVATSESLKDEIKDDIHLAGVKDFFRTLLADGPAGDQLRAAIGDTSASNIASGKKLQTVLEQQGIWGKLPPEFQKALDERGLAGVDNRLRLAAIVKSPEFQAARKSGNAEAFVSHLTVFDSLAFFDKMEGANSISVSDAAKATASQLTGKNKFADDAWVQEAEQYLKGIAAGNYNVTPGSARIMI